MIRSASIALLLAALLAAPARAQSDLGPDLAEPFAVIPDPAPETGDLDPATPAGDRIELLFERLRLAETPMRATTIARNIQRLMVQSGSPTVDLLMRRADALIREKEFARSLDLLDAVVRLKPDYAEGWNRRATVHYLRDDYGRSLADIEQVLALEPRHWGALSGLALIFTELDEREEALAAVDRALAVYPFLEPMKTRRDKLNAELQGEAI